MSLYWKIPISVTLRAPWVTPGDAAPGPATDVVLARNEDGNFILPATLIKGVLRGAMEVVAKDSAALTIGFGKGSVEEKDKSDAKKWRVANERDRAALIFGDLVCGEKGDKDKRTQRVEIDDELGAAKDGHLLFVECPFAFGTPVTFKGEVLFLKRPDLSETEVKSALQKATIRVFALGGMKSVGFGRVEGWDIGDPVPVSYAKVRPPARYLELCYKIDRPFLVDVSRHSGNLMVGSDVIPGGAIKGVLASGFKMAGLGADDFLSQLNIGHAHPEGRKVLPLSLSLCDDQLACNLGRAPQGFHKFAPNWKAGDEDNAREILGASWTAPDIGKTGRSRTAINPKTMGANYEDGSGDLFSQVAVRPGKMRWIGTMHDPSGSGDLETALGLLNAGLPGLGKTGAVIEVKNTAALPAPSPPGGTIDLCLTSDACLFDVGNTKPMRESYETYFDALGFTLLDFYAQQSLRGGYLALRYPPQPGLYQPWLLTEAGSVFRLEVGDKANLADILTDGLPPHPEYEKRGWQEFPFLRENGFGHVAVFAGVPSGVPT